MFHYDAITGYVDRERPLTIDVPSPDREGGGRVLVLVERIDGVEGDFAIDTEELVDEAILGAELQRAQILLASVRDGASRLWARVRSEAPGWFRARVVWVKDALPKAPCVICRRVLATLVAAGFALAGVPMPDLTLGEVAPEVMDSVYDALHTPPLEGFLRQIHADLPDIVGNVLRGFNLMGMLLGQVYKQCCIQLGFC